MSQSASPRWKRGRGLTGLFKPLIGSWIAHPAGEEPASRAPCTRQFTPVWGGAYVRLEAHWPQLGGRAYEEMALFGRDRDGGTVFWSFTSDGKQSRGFLADGSDVHPDAIAFQAEMPAGTARFLYWPNESNGFYFAVESRTKSGWNRFLRHDYHVASPADETSGTSNKRGVA